MDKFEMEHLDIDKQKELDELIVRIIGPHTIIICHDNVEERRKEGVASAIYISYQDKEYIISVGHTFNEFSIKNLYLGLVNIPISALQGIIYRPSSDNNFSELDYSIFLLNDEISNQLKTIYAPFRINESVKQYRFTSIWNIVFGYPATQNISKLHCDISKIKYCCMRLPFHDKEINLKSFDISKHIPLTFIRDQMIKTEQLLTGNTLIAPKLHGISGCGIWSVSDYPFVVSDYSLLGMIIGKNDDKQIIIGFTIQDIVETIECTLEDYTKNNYTGIITSDPKS